MVKGETVPQMLPARKCVIHIDWIFAFCRTEEGREPSFISPFHPRRGSSTTDYPIPLVGYGNPLGFARLASTHFLIAASQMA